MRHTSCAPARGHLLAALLALMTAWPAVAQERTVTTRGELETIEHLPEQYDPSQPAPLVVALHGFAASATDWDWAAPAFTRRGAILVGVQAPYTFVREDGTEGRDWFRSHTGDRDIVAATVPTTVAALIETIALLRREYAVSELYLLGFSQGGRLTYRAGPGHHDLIDGMAIFGAGFDPAVMDEAAVRESAGQMRVFIGHGMSDRIDLSNATNGRDYLRSAGYEVTFQSFNGGHALPPPMITRTVDWILGER